jgi:protocatechuate 3,4-dioxygenase beta subunit
MKHVVIDRRNFLKQASTAAVVVPTFVIGMSTLAGCSNEPVLAENVGPLSWTSQITDKKEPGEPMIITGTIFGLDGKTPLKSASLSVYHTDARGNYSPSVGGDNRTTRLRGKMLTGADGKYEFRSIRPASYPNSTVTAHVHAYVAADGIREYWIDNYVFEGDPFMSETERQRLAAAGNFSSLIKLTRGSDGVLRGSRDIRVENCSSRCV